MNDTSTSRDGAPADWYSELAKEIRRRREASGMSREAVAEAISAAAATIRSYEYGTRRPSVYTLAQIAHVLGCTVNDFLSGAGEPNAGAVAWEIHED
jgi:transcriptional regulator with XRE-family HTH domain